MPVRFSCDTDRTQTCNLLIRSQMLYSIKLRCRSASGVSSGMRCKDMYYSGSFQTYSDYFFTLPGGKRPCGRGLSGSVLSEKRRREQCPAASLETGTCSEAIFPVSTLHERRPGVRSARGTASRTRSSDRHSGRIPRSWVRRRVRRRYRTSALRGRRGP